MKKFALISHVLPPSHSGQAIVLYHLLKTLPDDKYCLITDISQRNQRANSATELLNAEYFYIDQKDTLNLSKLPEKRIFRLIYAGPYLLKVIYKIFILSLKIRKIVKSTNADLLIACSGNFYYMPAASLAARYLGIEMIPYVFDDYVYQWPGINRIIARLFEKQIFKRSRRAIVPNEFIAREYNKRYGVTPILIRNLCDFRSHVKVKESIHLNRKFKNIVYTGTVYNMHYDALSSLVQSLDLYGNKEIKFHIFGRFNRDSLEYHKINGDNVELHENVPNSDIQNILTSADVLFLPLSFNMNVREIIRTSAPGKIGDYLFSRTPVLVHAPADSFISWYFKSNHCGLVIDEYDSEKLFKGVNEILKNNSLRKDLVESAMEIAKREFDSGIISQQFRAIL